MKKFCKKMIAYIVAVMIMILEISVNTGQPVKAQDKEMGKSLYFGNYVQNLVTDQDEISALKQCEFVDGKLLLQGVHYRIRDGKYYKDAPIEWEILKEEGDYYTLISKKILEIRAFDDGGDFWDTSTIRKWLNDTFFQEAFSTKEQNQVEITTLKDIKSDWGTGSNPYYPEGESYNVDTNDKVYLLSYSDVQDESLGFASGETSVNARVAYKSQYIDVNESAGRYWLRGPGCWSYGNLKQRYVNPDGSLGSWYCTYGYGIRPVIRVKKNASEISTTRPEDKIINFTYIKEEENYRNKKVANATIHDDIKFNGMDTKITLPEDIPVIGGDKISLDFGMLPIAFETSGNEFRIGIGVETKKDDNTLDGLYNLKEDGWKKVKKYVEQRAKKAKSDLKDDLNKGKNLFMNSNSNIVSLPGKTDVETKVYGYAEGIIDNGKVKAIEGKINIEFTYSAGKKWQVIVASVPIVISAKMEAGVEQQYEIGLDFEKSSLYVDGDLKLTLPKVKLSAGVGVAYIADVSVYGQIENILEISHKDGNDRIRDYVTGEMGISASLLFGSYEKVLWSKEKTVYDSEANVATSSLKKQSTLSEKDFSIERTSDQKKKWMKKATITEEANQITTLQKGVYNQANPKVVVTETGTKLMVYTADDPTRTTGNHTVIMYSLYDEDTQSWQKPQYVDDDGTADFYPDVATDGKEIFLTWVNAKTKDFSAESTISEVAKDCEISVAKFDTTTNSFSESTMLTANNYVDIRPSLLVKGSHVYVAWISNSENDLISSKGTNQVHYAQYANNVWNEKDVVYATEEKPIHSVKVGMFNKEPMITYAVDQDNDVQTTEDCYTYMGKMQEKPKQMLTDKKGVRNVNFATLSDGRQIIYFSAEDALWYSADLETSSCLLEGNISEYQIMNGNGSDFIIGSEASEQGTNVYGYIWKNGEVSKPIALTKQNTYIQNPNGFYENGTYYLVFTRADMKIDETDLQVSTDICSMQFNSYSDISIDSMEVDEETVVPGKESEIQLTVTNNGFESLASYEVQVKCDGTIVDTKKIEESIQSGETKTITFMVQIPEDFTAGKKVECQIINSAFGDADESNNKIEMQLANPDIGISVFPNEEEKKVSVYMSNTSGFDSNGTLEIHDTDSSGKVLLTKDLGVVKAGELRNLVYTEEELEKLASESGTLYLEVVSENDAVWSNNYGFVFIKGSEDTEVIPTTAPPNETLVPTAQPTKQPIITPTPTSTPKTTTTKVTKPAKVKIKSVKSTGKKKIKVTWKWDYKADGYQVQYALNKKFTKGKKTKNAGTYSEAKTLTKLKSKKNYYVRVRAYKKVDGGKIYGKWSTVKKCKVK